MGFETTEARPRGIAKHFNRARLGVLVLATSGIALAASGPSSDPATDADVSAKEFILRNMQAPVMIDGKTPATSAAGRAVRMEKMPASYTKKFDLSALPLYAPTQKVKGVIRIWGNNYIENSGLSKAWATEFKSFHPEVRFDFVLPTAAVAFSGLALGQADLGMAQAPGFYDSTAHARVLGYEPTGIRAVTGAFNQPGWLNTLVIVVHKDNPLTKISMDQLDGVFGAARGRLGRHHLEHEVCAWTREGHPHLGTTWAEG